MRRDYCAMDLAVTFIIFIIGASEAAHLLGAFIRKPLAECAVYLAVFAGVACVALVLLCIWHHRGRRKTISRYSVLLPAGKDVVMLVVIMLFMISQMLFILMGKGAYRQGDITVETVGSFLQTGSIHGVNPMTGNPYTSGMPFRWKVLCLPTLYACLSDTFLLEPSVLVKKVIPVVVLLVSYAAYGCLARSLFPDNRSKRLLFMTITALLIWVGDYRLGMDGFGLLRVGWQGVTIRNTILVPYTVSLCLRRNYLHAILCCLAEACVVWTCFGLGACAFVTAGLALATLVLSGGSAERKAGNDIRGEGVE